MHSHSFTHTLALPKCDSWYKILSFKFMILIFMCMWREKEGEECKKFYFPLSGLCVTYIWLQQATATTTVAYKMKNINLFSKVLLTKWIYFLSLSLTRCKTIKLLCYGLRIKYTKFFIPEKYNFRIIKSKKKIH
jgi:hypothetical protein